jgi:hypothetical protein
MNVLSANKNYNLDIGSRNRLLIILSFGLCDQIDRVTNQNVAINVLYMGHDQLLKICLLEKSAQHDFIIAQQRSSNNKIIIKLLTTKHIIFQIIVDRGKFKQFL